MAFIKFTRHRDSSFAGITCSRPRLIFRCPVVPVPAVWTLHQDKSPNDTACLDTTVAAIAQSFGRGGVAAARRTRRWRCAHGLLLRAWQSHSSKKTEDLHHGDFFEICAALRLASNEISLGSQLFFKKNSITGFGGVFAYGQRGYSRHRRPLYRMDVARRW